MKRPVPCLALAFAASLALSALSACASGGGTEEGTGGSGTGGSSATGGRTGTGGIATGGASATGGAAATGGARTGGSNATGGTTTGGKASGGSASGGASGGAATGGAGGAAATGGAATGGAGAGGKATGGVAGAIATGGSSTGGSSTGGKSGTGGTPASPGAPESKPTGYGQATTGGGNAAAKNVASWTEMQAAIDAYGGSGGLVLNYTGKFDFAAIKDPCTQWKLPAQIVEIKKKNDITILGADGSGANFGLHIASSSSNIIVRNMTFGLLPGADASDAISVEGMSGGFPTDIWIDHNEFFSSLVTCSGAGDTSFDGLMDFKKGADRVTVSYNYVHDHHKVSLNGYTDSDDAVRHITFHHNVFDNIGSRVPLQRHGYSHVYDNVISNVSASGINVRMGGYSLIEANHFEKVNNPVTSRDSDALGFWELRNNNIRTPADFTTWGITWAPSDNTPTKDATDWTTTAAYPVALGYSYTTDPASCLPGNLKAVAGAGKKLATLKCP